MARQVIRAADLEENDRIKLNLADNEKPLSEDEWVFHKAKNIFKFHKHRQLTFVLLPVRILNLCNWCHKDSESCCFNINFK